MSEPQHAVDAAAAAASAASVATKGVWTGAGAAVASWLVSSEAGVVCGMLLGIISLVIQWWYRAQQNRREEEAHRVQMATLQRNLGADGR